VTVKSFKNEKSGDVTVLQTRSHRVYLGMQELVLCIQDLCMCLRRCSKDHAIVRAVAAIRTEY